MCEGDTRHLEFDGLIPRQAASVPEVLLCTCPKSDLAVWVWKARAGALSRVLATEVNYQPRRLISSGTNNWLEHP